MRTLRRTERLNNPKLNEETAFAEEERETADSSTERAHKTLQDK